VSIPRRSRRLTLDLHKGIITSSPPPLSSKIIRISANSASTVSQPHPVLCPQTETDRPCSRKTNTSLLVCQHVRLGRISFHLRSLHSQAEIILPLGPQRSKPPLLWGQSPPKLLAPRHPLRDMLPRMEHPRGSIPTDGPCPDSRRESSLDSDESWRAQRTSLYGCHCERLGSLGVPV
jgi:hypothetical protein